MVVSLQLVWWTALALACAALVLLLAAFSAYCLYTLYIRWKCAHIPSPKGQSFLLGHLSEFNKLRKDEPMNDLLRRWNAEYGPVFVIFYLCLPSVVSCNPEDVQLLCTSTNVKKSKFITDFFSSFLGERFLGSGLFTTREYDRWKPRRSVYDPAFNRSFLKSLVPRFCECAEKLVERLRPLADGKACVPMKKFIQSTTLEVISKIAFSTDFKEEWRDQYKSLGLKRAKGEGIEFLLDYSLQGWQKFSRNPYFYQFLHPFEAESYRETVRALRKLGRECILRRIEAMQAGEKKEAPNDILSHILQVAVTDSEADIEQLVDDFVTFYLAGQETTANTLSFALILVLQNTQVLERLLTEVRGAVGNRRDLVYEDVEKLQYTGQVIEETLRLHGPVGGVTKDTPDEGIVLSDCFIPGGITVTLFTAAMCRMPEYFDDPDTFDPGRFDPENKRPSPFVYFPFGVGHRACIGRHFAMMEAKLILAKLFQYFSFSLPPNYKLAEIQKLTVQPHDDVCVTVSPVQE